MSKSLIWRRTASRRHAHCPQHCNEACPISAGPVAGNRTRKLQRKPGQRGLCLFLPLAILGSGGHGRARTAATQTQTVTPPTCPLSVPCLTLTFTKRALLLHRAAVGLAEHGCLGALQPVTTMVLLFLLRRARHRCDRALSLCPLWSDCYLPGAAISCVYSG